MAAARPPEVRVRVSLGVNLAMALVLVDYTLYGARPAGPWAEALAAALPAQARLDLAALHAVLVHGLVLRDALARLPESPARWEDLRAGLATWDAARWRDLIVEGCASNLAYAGDRVPTGWDATPAGYLGTVEAVAAGWNATDLPRLRRLAAAPAVFGAVVLGLLDALWQAGAGEAWTRAAPRLAHAARAAESARRRLPPGLAPAALVAELTGRHPPADWAGAWDGVATVWLLPCCGMGPLLSCGSDGPAAYVCYEPVEEPAPGPPPAAPPDGVRPAEALQALAGAVRSGVWQALREGGELYAGQIAAVCGRGPSAVSRSLGPLEQAGLVRVRRAGPAKFFSIDGPALARLLDSVRPGPP